MNSKELTKYIIERDLKKSKRKSKKSKKNKDNFFKDKTYFS